MWTLIWSLAFLPVLLQITEAGYCSSYYYCTQARTKSVYYTRSCGWNGWSRCAAYYLDYESYGTYCIQYYCCAGWTNPACSVPVCFGYTTCPNGGTCSSPDYCTCPSGFQSPRCDDIDECAVGTGYCNANSYCVNTHGAYYCECSWGYVRAADGVNCIPQCFGSTTCPNNGVCTSPDMCQCPDGFVAPQCDDIDECATGTGYCNLNEQCVNTHGAYDCDCSAGYVRDENGINCIPQCFGSTTCPNNGVCTSPDMCQCPDGFVAPQCDDINECLDPAIDCGLNKQCLNNIGSYTCVCADGLELDIDGLTCIDIDECLDPSTCDYYCDNTFGSYNCSCDPGYNSVGAACVDDDECLVNNGDCQQQCVNEPGSFYCECFGGYELNPAGICIDINECLMYRGGCEDICTNSPGSFECSCRPTRTLRPDNRSCSDVSSRDTVFEKYQLPRKQLPDPCYDILLTTCNDDTEVVLSSTSIWYTLHNDTNVFFTYGITFAKLQNSYIPISMQGIVVTQNTSLGIVHYVLYTEEDGVTKSSTMTSSRCAEFNFTNTDIFDFVTADSFIKTYFVSLDSRLPSWLKFRKSTGTIIFITDMKSKLVYGSTVDTLRDCTGAPVKQNHLYSVFTFQSDFTVDNLVKTSLDSTNMKNDYCFMIDLCLIYGGAVFIMIPEEQRVLIDDIHVIKSLKGEEMKLDISPYGLGFSLNDGIDVDPPTELETVWTGFDLIKNRISRVADVWIGGDIVKTDTYFVVNGSADLFLDLPDIEQMFVSIERQEWQGMLDIDMDVAPMLTFKFLNNWYVVNITSAEDTVGALLSFGDPERSYCESYGNPAGFFFKLTIAQTPFQDVPYLKDWFLPDSQWYGFLAYTPKDIPTSYQHFSNEIFDVLPELLDLMDKIESHKQEVSDYGSADLFMKLANIQTGVSVFQNNVGSVLLEGWEDPDIDGTIYLIEMLRQFYGYVDEAIIGFNDDAEFISNNAIEILYSSFNTSTNEIKLSIGNTSISVTDAIITEVGSYTGFGFKGTTDLVLFGLVFESIDVELFHSATNLFDCSKFKTVVDFSDNENAMSLIGRLTQDLTLGHFLTVDGKIYGAFALDTNKVAIQFSARTTMLGIQYFGDVFITPNKGIYFDIKGNVWGIYKAIINVTAEVEKPWDDLIYVLNGKFSTRSGTTQFLKDSSIFEEVFLNALRNYVSAQQSRAKRALATANSIFDRMQTLLTVAQDWLDEAAEEKSIASSNFDLATSLLESAEANLESLEAAHLEASNELAAAQDVVANLCQIQECSQICYPGIVCRSRCKRKQVSCCRYTACKYRAVDEKCTKTNDVCQETIDNAYAALADAVEQESELQKELRDAQNSTSSFQAEVESSRNILEAAEIKHEAAQSNYDSVSSLYSAAEASLEVVNQSNHVNNKIDGLIKTYGLASLIKVRDCDFTVEMTTEDVSIFNVSCDVKAFRLNWQTFVLNINFNIAQQSINLAAISTATSLIDAFADSLNRKKRSIEFEQPPIMDVLLISSPLRNETIDPNGNINCINSDHPVTKQHVKSHVGTCNLFKYFINVLSNAFATLLETTAASKRNIKAARYLAIPFYQSKLTTMEKSYENDIFSIGYNDKNVSDVNISAYLAESKSNQMDFVDILRLHRIDFRHECVCVWDCILHSLTSIMYLLDDYPQAKHEKLSIHKIEDGFDAALKLAPFSPTEEITRVLENSLNEIKRLNNSTLFCVSPLTIKHHPVNATVLSGTNVTFSCLAVGGSDLLYNWYKNTNTKLEGNTRELTLENITKEDNGLQIHCRVESELSSEISLPAFLTVVDNDEDECLQNDDSCDYTCINYHGEYECTCDEGYTFNSDNHSCDDINECSIDNGGCAYSCINIKGSNKCICNHGYTGDGKDGSCNDIDECETDNGGCQQICMNTLGTYQCKCNEGYKLNDDTHQCGDINECKTNNGNCEHRCYNTEGSYKCSCIDGFTLDADLRNCSSKTQKY